MGAVSGIGYIVAVTFRLLNAPEAITVLIPILETIWPVLLIGIGCGSLALLIDVFLEYDSRLAGRVIQDLERFSSEGTIQFHPILPRPDLNARKTPHAQWYCRETR